MGNPGIRRLNKCSKRSGGGYWTQPLVFSSLGHQATPLWLGVLLTALKSEAVKSGRDMKHSSDQGTSLVVQWLEIRVPMWGMGSIPGLGRFHMPVSHNY